jgi:hypothetical protein
MEISAAFRIINQTPEDAAMRRYHFHINGNGGPNDLEMTYPDFETMRSEAVQIAGESIREIGRNAATTNNGHWSLQVKNDSGIVVFLLTVEIRD